MKRPCGEGIIILKSSLWPPVPLIGSPLQYDRRPKHRSQPKPGGLNARISFLKVILKETTGMRVPAEGDFRN